MKKDENKINYHPATHGGSHFIFSPENPRAENTSGFNPEQVKHQLKLMGETVEDTHGSYGGLERSFIVHDPKNIDKLHQLAHNLGQESAIVSKDGAHEMHYYHGANAGKVRHGNGSSISEQKPDDFYTKVSTPTGTTRFFSHSFDWDDKNLKTKPQNIAKSVFASLNNGNEYIESKGFSRYFNLILGDYLEKNAIRTEGRVFVSMDGDNIGASVQRAAMANDIDTIMKQSQKIAEGQRFIRKWAQENKADIYIDGGDDISFTLPAETANRLGEIQRGYFNQTSFTVTIGIGDSISQSGKAMLYGKLKGKNQINQWSPEIEKELERISVELSPEQKLHDHGLLTKDAMSAISAIPANNRTPEQKRAHSSYIKGTQPSTTVHTSNTDGGRTLSTSTTGPFTTSSQTTDKQSDGRHSTGADSMTNLNVKDATPSMKQWYSGQAASQTGIGKMPGSAGGSANDTKEAAGALAGMTNKEHYAPPGRDNIPGSGASNSNYITSWGAEKTQKDELPLEKAEPPPKKPGQASLDGRYTAQHHKPAKMLAWRYNDQLSSNYDKDIADNKDTYVKTHPEQNQGVVDSFINNIANHPFRHFVISRDTHNGGDQIRARHVRGLLAGDKNYNIEVQDPNTLHFNINERHGANQKSSSWSYDKKTNKVTQRNALGNSNASNTYNKNESGSWYQPLGYDQSAVYGLLELVQHIRYHGESIGGGSFIDISRLNKSDTRNLIHYSVKSGLTTADPKNMGSGLGQRGAESKHGRPGVERSYFYKEGTDPESVITSIGKARYTATLDPEHKIYDIGKDSDGIHDKLKSDSMKRDTNRGMVTSDDFLQAVKGKGYHGFENSQSHLPNVVALFHPHPVKEDTNYRKNEMNLTKSNENEDMMDNINAEDDAKRKGIPTVSDYSEHKGKNVFVYFNLHKNLWSVKDRKSGKVLFHSHRVSVDKPNLTVGEKGRQRVLREKAKNVHAGVSGTLSDHKDLHSSEPQQISYNPYKSGNFYHAGKDPETSPVHSADHVDLQLAEISTPKGILNVPHVRAFGAKHNGYGTTAEGEQIPIDPSNFGSKRSVEKSDIYIWSLYEDIQKSKNIKEQKKKTFGKDAQGSRTSPNRQKMMQTIQSGVKKLLDLEMTVAQGKRDPTGELKSKDKPIEKEPFDVFSTKGLSEEKNRLTEIKNVNTQRAALGLPAIKRTDPKPDWRGGQLETQPSPDAAIHELAHLYQAPLGESLGDTQENMDRVWGESQNNYGHMQQKKTAGEVQPMALENKLRRRLGLPAHSSSQNPESMSEHDRPVEETVDGTGPRFTRGVKQTGKGPKSVDYIRSSRLLSPENKERLDQIDGGELKYDPENGWQESDSVNAKINRRARESTKGTSKGYFKDRLDSIKANKGVTPLASSEKIDDIKNRYKTDEIKVPYNEYFKGLVQKKKDQFKQDQSVKEKDPFKENLKINTKKTMYGDMITRPRETLGKDENISNTATDGAGNKHDQTAANAYRASRPGAGIASGAIAGAKAVGGWLSNTFGGGGIAETTTNSTRREMQRVGATETTTKEEVKEVLQKPDIKPVKPKAPEVHTPQSQAKGNALVGKYMNYLKQKNGTKPAVEPPTEEEMNEKR